MQIERKLQLLGYVRRPFPTWEWPLERQARIVGHAYDERLAAGKHSSARNDIERQADFEADEYREELRELRSQKLMRKAGKLRIDTGTLE